VPLFISRRRLEKLNRLPRARGPYAIDSGGFTELSKYGAWAITVDRYIAEVRRCADCIGVPVFAAQMDHICERSSWRKLRVLLALPTSVRNTSAPTAIPPTCGGNIDRTLEWPRGGLAKGMTAVVEGLFVHNMLVVYTPDATSVRSAVAGK
jgi:hypothetical protein